MSAQNFHSTHSTHSDTDAPSSKYAILMETNGGEYESWYNFIRYEGNEEALAHLDEQLKKVEFYILDDLSTFDLELTRMVSEETARQMCKIDVNAYMFHRKFDGKLERIDFKFSKRDSNDDRIEKVNEKIGMGDIDQYITHEDPCDSDFSKHSESSSSNSSDSDSDSDSNSERYSESSDDDYRRPSRPSYSRYSKDSRDSRDYNKDKKDKKEKKEVKEDKKDEKKEKRKDGKDGKDGSKEVKDVKEEKLDSSSTPKEENLNLSLKDLNLNDEDKEKDKKEKRKSEKDLKLERKR